MIGRLVFLLLLLALLSSGNFTAQTTAFNYQGKLTDGGTPANGSFQIQFKLFDSAGGAGQVGSTITDVPVTVSQGIFSVKLDFGANALSGANRWLEIAVRRNSGESYVTLSPREQIASSPYAVRTLSAASADNAANLGGIPAGEYVTTSGGGTSFIRNGAAVQTGSFNISGNGFFGGNVGIGTTTPFHRLALGGGPAWTTHGWGGLLDLQNASAIGWRANAGGTRFGMGHTNDGFFIFRTASELGNTSAVPIYDLKMDNAGNIGIGSLALNSDVSQARLNIFNLSLGYGFLNTLGSVSVGSYVDASGGSYGTRSNHPLRFFTNNGSPQMTLATNGNFGVGTESPSQLVHVNSIGNAASLVQTATNAFAQYQLKSGPANTWTIGTQDNFALGGLLFRNGGSDLMNILPNGDIVQPRDKRGFAKAMLYVNGDGTLLRCYNGVTGASTGNCGFSTGRAGASQGFYEVNFGFQINDRFYLALPTGFGANASIDFDIGGNPNRLLVSIEDSDGDGSDRPFTLIVF